MLGEEYERKSGNRTAALLRGILNPRARHATLVTCWLLREEEVAQYRVAAGADLQQAVQVATVVEHAPAAYRDLLKVVPLANR